MSGTKMEESPIGMCSLFRTQELKKSGVRTQVLEKSRTSLGKREIEDEDEFEDD